MAAGGARGGRGGRGRSSSTDDRRQKLQQQQVGGGPGKDSGQQAASKGGGAIPVRWAHPTARPLSKADVGATVEGVVTNVTSLGTFLDVGFVKDGLLTRHGAPSRRFRVGDFVSGLTVEAVDASKSRLTLAFLPEAENQHAKPRPQIAQSASAPSGYMQNSIRGRTTGASLARRSASSSPVPKRSPGADHFGSVAEEDRAMAAAAFLQRTGYGESLSKQDDDFCYTQAPRLPAARQPLEVEFKAQMWRVEQSAELRSAMVSRDPSQLRAAISRAEAAGLPAVRIHAARSFLLECESDLNTGIWRSFDQWGQGNWKRGGWKW